MKTLKAHHKDILAKAAKIAETAQGANRDMTAAEVAEFDELIGKAQRLADALSIAEGEGVEESPGIKSFTARLDDMEERLNTPVLGKSIEQPTTFKSGKIHYEVVSGKQRFSSQANSADLGAFIQGACLGEIPEHQKSQVVSVDAQGGYLLANRFQQNVIDMARDRSIMAAAGALTYQIQEASTNGTVFVRVAGEPLLSWVREMQLIPEGTFSFSAITCTPKKLAVLIKLSREMLEATNAAKLIGDQLVKGFASEMDRVLLMGSGAGAEPQGVLNTAGIGSITSVGDVLYDDFLNGIKTVRNGNYEPSGMIYSPATAYELSILKAVTDGQYLTPPEDFTRMPKHVTKKITDALAAVGQWNMCGWVMGGPMGGLRLEFGVAGDSFKEDAIYLRAVMAMDTVILDPAAFTKLSGLS